jgi:hypothetical protein
MEQRLISAENTPNIAIGDLLPHKYNPKPPQTLIDTPKAKGRGKSKQEE